MKILDLQYTAHAGWSKPVVTCAGLDSPNTVVFIFGAPEFLSLGKLFEEIRQSLPLSHLVGCSSSGEIFGNRVYDQSLSVAVVKFEHTKVKKLTLTIDSPERSFEVGQALGNGLRGPDLANVFLLSDGLVANGSELAGGVSAALPGTIVTGGLAGDGGRFKETWVLSQQGKLVSGFVSALGFYGKKLKVGHGSQGGWDIFGPERLVTKSQGNVLYELDGQSALQIYKEYLGEKAAGLPAAGLVFPLQVWAQGSSNRKFIRTIRSVDELNQSMTFAGNIPQGSLAQLMLADFDRLVEGASKAALEASNQVTSAVLALAISCVGRRLVLGERTEEEVEATLACFPKGSTQLGFYSYGEISPFGPGQTCELQNQTMTITTLREE